MNLAVSNSGVSAWEMEKFDLLKGGMFHALSTIQINGIFRLENFSFHDF